MFSFTNDYRCLNNSLTAYTGNVNTVIVIIIIIHLNHLSLLQ